MRRLSTPAAVLTFVLVAASLAAALAAQPAEGKRPRRQPDPTFAPIKDDPALPRVLLLGDSISIGYTLAVREALEGKANVHRPAANCGPTTTGLESLDKWLGDGKWDVIHFNWGLHDLKYIEGKQQVPLAEYEKNLQTLVQRLKKTGASLIWCSTTPVPKGVDPPREDSDVVAYNAAAAKIMQANGIACDDLYTFALPKLPQIQRPANVHFTPEGSKVLAGQVAAAILKALEAKKPRRPASSNGPREPQ